MPAAYQALIEAEQLWINGREVQCFAMGQPHTETSYTVSQGQPLFYRYVEDYILAFDCPLSDTELDSNDNYVSGWFMHPIITADNNMVKLPFKFIDIFRGILRSRTHALSGLGRRRSDQAENVREADDPSDPRLQRTGHSVGIRSVTR
jgi:hypothetical protein